MDDRRFDAWTRSLATGLSRRNVLKGLFGGAVLGGAAVTRVDDAAAQGCEPGTFPCGSTCCDVALNCCGDQCCPSSQCHEALDICCLETEFACDAGTGDNACCDSDSEKCCNGECISLGLCCPTFEPEDCPAGSFCCEDFACHECCSVEDCVAAADSCIIVSCVEGVCQFNTIVCDVCETCDTGVCVDACEAGLTCCPSGCEDLQNDPTNCGRCAADCSADLLCCSGECLECCDDGDCDPCARCVEGQCEALVCEDPCELCLTGECERVCPIDLVCCISGPPTDITIECVEECCDDEDCDDCHHCNVDGVCDPDEILCEEGLLPCCVRGELVCAECCGHADCDECEICDEGRCEHDPQCCPRLGEPCGLIVNGSVEIAGPAPQEDCCPGLFCCEVAEGRVCAECSEDWHCPKGSICCGCVCREIECCIDDILTGSNPNDRCPDKCTCFEGICVDEHQRRCRECDHDKDCPHGKCCCKDGTCSEHCCDRVCHDDKDCPHGKCCCHDGSCSADCCKRPDKPTPTTSPPVGGPQVGQLPSTGVGDDDDGLGIIGAAALGAAAAYIAGKTLRDAQTETAPAEAED